MIDLMDIALHLRNEADRLADAARGHRLFQMAEIQQHRAVDAHRDVVTLAGITCAVVEAGEAA